MGLSDIAVSKRLKTMGSAFYGRSAAYAAALDAELERGTLRGAGAQCVWS